MHTRHAGTLLLLSILVTCLIGGPVVPRFAHEFLSSHSDTNHFVANPTKQKSKRGLYMAALKYKDDCVVSHSFELGIQPKLVALLHASADGRINLSSDLLSATSKEIFHPPRSEAFLHNRAYFVNG